MPYGLAAYNRYNRLMRERNAVDFPDLIRRAISLMTLEQYQEEVGDKVRRRFSYVMVDEFQDTTKVQMQVSLKSELTGYSNRCANLFVAQSLQLLKAVVGHKTR